MNDTHLTPYLQRYPNLRVFTDKLETRFCHTIASDQLVFQNSSDTFPRPMGELLEIVEETLGGKFQLPVETSAEKSLEPVSSRSTDSTPHRQLATLEIWSLEDGAYDLVLKVPNAIAQDDNHCAPLIGRFIDQAREINRVVDNLDLLRYQAGLSLGLRDAKNRLRAFERDSGTRLDSESLFALLQDSFVDKFKKSLN